MGGGFAPDFDSRFGVIEATAFGTENEDKKTKLVRLTLPTAAVTGVQIKYKLKR